VVSQPATVDAFARTALDAGATSLKPAAKQFWGERRAARLRGRSTRWCSCSESLISPRERYYVDHGLHVARTFARTYVEFTAPATHIKLGLYKRRALAKDASVSPTGSGSHRLVIGSDAGPFTDPDGFAWEAA
jgi:hypothetical protein